MPSLLDGVYDLYDRGLNVFPLMEDYRRNGDSECVQGMVRIAQQGRISRDAIKKAFNDNYRVGVMTGRTSGGLLVIRCDDYYYHKLLARANANHIHLWAFSHINTFEIWVRADTWVRSYEITDGFNVIATRQIRNVEEYIEVPASYPMGRKDEYQPPTLTKTQLEILGIEPALRPYPDKSQTNRKKGITVQSEGNLGKEEKKRKIRHYEGISVYMADKYIWQGKGAMSDLATMAGLIQIAATLPIQKATFTASQRQIARYAHLEHETVGKSLKRLKSGERPVLVATKNEYTNALVYRFNPKHVRTGKNILKKQDQNKPFSHDIYRTNTILGYGVWFIKYPDLLEKGALEYPGLLIHALIAQQLSGMRQTEVVEHLRFSPKVIKIACKRLIDLGLLELLGTYQYGAVKLTDDLCNAVIDQADVRGKAEKRQQQDSGEQQQYLDKMIIYYRERCDGDNM